MARPAKYSEDDLLIAVHEYSKVYPGKIMVSKLAVWASANIPSLFGVRANDFQRPRRTKDADKTGKDKACLLLIKEINQTRRSCDANSSNVLLNSSDITDFFNLPLDKQIEGIRKARMNYDSLRKSNQKLSLERRLFYEENCILKKKCAEISLKQEQLQEELQKVKNLYSMLEATVDEHRRRKLLADLGIEAENLDPIKAFNSLSLRLDEIENMFSFERTSIANSSELKKLDAENDKTENLRKKILTGINFGGNT